MSGILAALVSAGAAGGPVVSIDDQSISDLTTETALAFYRLENDAEVREERSGGVNILLETWLEPTDAPKSPYEARATLVTGTSPNTGSAMSTWLPLTTSVGWGLTVSTAGFPLSCELLIEIRDAGSGSVLDTATVFLNVEVLI